MCTIIFKYDRTVDDYNWAPYTCPKIIALAFTECAQVMFVVDRTAIPCGIGRTDATVLARYTWLLLSTSKYFNILIFIALVMSH